MTWFRSPGLWLLLAGLETMFLVHLAELMYPGYSVSENFISDLGVGPAAPATVFTIALILFGVLALVAAYLLRDSYKRSWLWLLVALSGIGAIGVAIFNENAAPRAHSVSAFLAFFFGNLAVILSSRLVRAPLSIVLILLGLIGLAALALFGSKTYLGLGPGGMERMIFYPAMFWALCFGGYLMAKGRNEMRHDLG